jgi:hypothetical protein
MLRTEVGKPLRIDGLKWIADAMKANPELGKWFRDRTSNAFMEFLDVLVSEHLAELVRDDSARRGLLDLSAHAVCLAATHGSVGFARAYSATFLKSEFFTCAMDCARLPPRHATTSQRARRYDC